MTGDILGAAPRLSVRGLSKRYGAILAVDAVALEALPGEIIGFVGPNGAGKTTTLRLLAGLLKADAGVGSVLGHDLITARAQIRRRVGYMPQRLTLYGDLTVADNLRFRADVYELAAPARAVAETLADFGLTERSAQRADQLSGGWGRRLQLAATLIHKPDLVLLDEPTAGLDAESRQDVWQRLARLAWSGVTVVINTHDLIEAEQCGRAALFSGGKVLAFDTPEAIALAVPFETWIVGGVEPARAGPSFAALTGVIAAMPLGRRLKLVLKTGAAASAQVLATSLGATMTAAPRRLEDAAIALSSSNLSHLAAQGVAG